MIKKSLRLGDLIEIKHGFAFPGAGFSDHPSLPVLVTPGNFAIGGGFQHRNKTFAGQVPDGYELSPGDLIITMTDLSKNADTLGAAAMVPADGRRYLHNQRIGKVVLTRPDLVDARFLCYYLRDARYRSYVIGTASGSTVRHTSPGRIEAFSAEFPDVRDQRSIAAVLGALDDKILANIALAGTADDLARAHFASWSTAADLQSLSAISTPILGGTPDRGNPDYWGPGVPWASARDIAAAQSGVLRCTAETITEAAASSAARLESHPVGSVFLTARGTVGAVARAAVASSINQSCYAFRAPEGRSALLYLTVLHGVDRMRAIAHGSVFSTITMSTVATIQVPDIRAFSREEAAISEDLLCTVTQAIRENDALAELRDALLPALMSGRLRVKDAERQVEDEV